jgi:catechol 2,3-dioxygenase-like lactoylglutathione lyase family enzyme
MIAHISIGVRDIDRSKRFYDAVLEPLGYKCLRAARTLQGYGYGRDSIALWVVQADHPVPADEKSGLHFCFTAANVAAVDAFHAAALRSGGQDTTGGRRRLRSSFDLDGWSRRGVARLENEAWLFIASVQLLIRRVARVNCYFPDTQSETGSWR